MAGALSLLCSRLVLALPTSVRLPFTGKHRAGATRVGQLFAPPTARARMASARARALWRRLASECDWAIADAANRLERALAVLSARTRGIECDWAIARRCARGRAGRGRASRVERRLHDRHGACTQVGINSRIFNTARRGHGFAVRARLRPAGWPGCRQRLMVPHRGWCQQDRIHTVTVQNNAP
jgi:hypothetical protein